MSQFTRAGSVMPPVPTSARAVIIAICVLQGLLLYFFLSHPASPALESLSHNIYGQTMAFTLPVLISLSVVHLNSRRFWGGIAVLTLLLAGMAAWLKSNMTGAPSEAVLFPFCQSLVLLVYFVLPWLQVQSFPPDTRYRYANLAACYSQNTLCLMLTVLLMLLTLGVMALCAALFRLIGIEYFHTLFFDTPLFMWLVYGLLLGISIYK